MNQKHFKNFNFTNFWDDNDYALKEYVNNSPSSELIKSVEKKLGYKLPDSYIELMKMHNGGIPNSTCFPTEEEIGWAEDHIAITGIFGIGKEKQYSLCGNLGSQFMIDEWGYPNIGVYICDTPSAGHEMVALDYSKCGKNGEPKVVYVNQERDYETTILAKNFEEFIKGLVNGEAYDTSAEDKEQDLQIVKKGKFSKLLSDMCEQVKSDFPQIEKIIRNIAKKITEEFGYFSMHADEHSYLLYDIQFWLYGNIKKIINKEAYLEIYPKIIAMSDGEFSSGYAPDFIKDWIEKHIKEGSIIGKNNGLYFSDEYIDNLKQKILKYE